MLCYKLLRPVLPVVQESNFCQTTRKFFLQENFSKHFSTRIHTCFCIINANNHESKHKNKRKLILNDYRPKLYFSSDQKPPITKMVGRQDVLRKVLQDKQHRLHQTELRIRGKGKLLLQDIRETKSKMKEKMENLHQTELKIRKSGKLIMNDIRETKSKMKEKMEEIIERENVMTVPNLLCVTRIALSPYLGYLIINHDFEIALGIVAFAGITDLLDGWIARTFKDQSSKLGSFLDPMADKVLIATMFLTLTYADIIPVPLTGLIITRDVLLVAAGFFIRYQSLPPPKTLSRYFDVTHATAQLAPTTISKVNTMVQLATVACTLAAPVFNYLEHPALHALWYLTAGTTVASALSYILSKNTYKFLKDNKR